MARLTLLTAAKEGSRVVRLGFWGGGHRRRRLAFGRKWFNAGLGAPAAGKFWMMGEEVLESLVWMREKLNLKRGNVGIYTRHPLFSPISRFSHHTPYSPLSLYRHSSVSCLTRFLSFVYIFLLLMRKYFIWLISDMLVFDNCYGPPDPLVCTFS